MFLVHGDTVPQLNDDLRKNFAYQPFEFPDGTVTGVGESYINGSTRRILLPEERTLPEAAGFIEANKRLGLTYEDFLSAISERFSDVSALSYCDVACNAGYFCYRMAQKGCRQVTGVDAANHKPAFDYLQQTMGINARFIQSPYNMIGHSCEGISGSFDIVSSIAFMCHSSDPQFLLNYLGSITKKALIIYSRFHRSSEYSIAFSEKTSLYFKQPFPICFDGATSLSTGILFMGLHEMGFNQIFEITRKPHWLLGPDFACFMAVR